MHQMNNEQENDYTQVMFVEGKGAQPEELNNNNMVALDMVDKEEFKEKHIITPKEWHGIRAKYIESIFGAMKKGNTEPDGRISHRKYAY